MTRARAKLLILIGWSYCIVLAHVLAISPRGHDPYNVRCQRHKIPLTVVRASGIIVIVSLVIIQVKTVLILKVRFHSVSGPGSTGISTARLHLYKRALLTAVAIGVVYALTWAPYLLLYILKSWSLGNREIIQKLLLIWASIALILQSFANALIFRLKNLNKSCFTWCKTKNQVSAIAVQPCQVHQHPGEELPGVNVQQHRNVEGNVIQQQSNIATCEQLEIALDDCDVCELQTSKV